MHDCVQAMGGTIVEGGPFKKDTLYVMNYEITGLALNFLISETLLLSTSGRACQTIWHKSANDISIYAAFSPHNSPLPN